MIDFRGLVKKGVHFGHQTSKWCPKMAPYILCAKNKIHLINAQMTAVKMEQAARFLESAAEQGQVILWVGTKKAAQGVIQDAAKAVGMPFVTHRSVGGTLTNYAQVKKSVTKLLHFEDILARADKFPHYTKKELSGIQKIVERLEKSVGGLRKLVWPIGALVVVDVNKERSAIQEARRMGVKIVGLVDTNCDPSDIDYVIPGNDDAPEAIAEVINYLRDAVQRGVTAAGERRANAQITLEESVDNAGVVALELSEEEQAVAARKKAPRRPVAANKVVPGKKAVSEDVE